MGYVYDDEDNEAMYNTEDLWMKYTTYSCKAEADYYENGGYERDLEAREAARDERRSCIREGFLDDLGFLRGSECRGCAWMLECVIEAFEDQVDDNLIMPGEAYNLAQRMCHVCRTTCVERREDALDEFFRKEDEGQ